MKHHLLLLAMMENKMLTLFLVETMAKSGQYYKKDQLDNPYTMDDNGEVCEKEINHHIISIY